jgi:outer membrane protein assembly factor BamB
VGQQIATGEPREIERIQDVDGRLAVDSGVVYAAGYRGQTAALIAQTGRPLWTHELSSFTGVALSASQVYAGDADSSIWALDLRTGSSEWKQDGLKYRWVGEIGVQGDAIVVGDFEGFVHWLSITDGKFRGARASEPIEAARSWSATSSTSWTSKAKSAPFAPARRAGRRLALRSTDHAPRRRPRRPSQRRQVHIVQCAHAHA